MGIHPKIGITGLPRSGKSAVLAKVLEMLEEERRREINARGGDGAGTDIIGGMRTEPLMENSERVGYKVINIKTGEEAIRTCRSFEQEFGLALLDINLPDMSGYQVASALRQLPQCQHTTLIALSAYSQDEEIQRAKDVGMAGFIKKPFRRDDIGPVLATLLASDEQQVGVGVDSSDTRDPAAEGFDHDIFSSMVDALGIESVSMIAEGLAREGRDNLEELSSGVEANDTESAERAAHTLASSCQSLGMMASGNYIRELEHGLRSGNEIDQSMLTKANDLFEADLTQLQSAVKVLI